MWRVMERITFINRYRNIVKLKTMGSTLVLALSNLSKKFVIETDALGISIKQRSCKMIIQLLF